RRSAEGLEHPVAAQVELFSEDLRGSHEDHLTAAVQGHGSGKERADGLAAAYIALKEPVHRLSQGHVSLDLSPRPLLARCQLIGQPGTQARMGGPGRELEPMSPADLPF